MSNFRKVFSEEQKQEICDFYQSGLSTKKIAQKFGVRTKRIYSILKDKQIPLAYPHIGQRRLTQEEKQDICARYQQGQTPKEIKAIHQIQDSTVYDILEQYGIKTKRGDFYRNTLLTKEEVAIRDMAIKTRFPTEGSLVLAKEFGTSVKAICTRAEKLGVKSKAKGRLMGETMVNRKSHLTKIFETWNNDMAYILGYLWADGSVHLAKGKYRKGCVEFKCSTEDEDLIIKVSKTIGSDAKIFRFPEKEELWSSNGKIYLSKPSSRIQISSWLLANCLSEKFGIKPRKSFIDCDYPDVPDDFLSHFARGNFDGDGSIHIRKNGIPFINFLGSNKFTTGLRDQICKVIGLQPHAVIWTGSAYRTSWTSIKETAKLLNWLYKDSDYLSLKRKKDKAMAAISNLQSRLGSSHHSKSK